MSVQQEFGASASSASRHGVTRLPSRSRLIVAGMAVFWLLLAGRLVQLQWLRRDALAERANRQRSYLETIPARPGEILDRHGRLLATSVSVRSLYLVPSRISNPWQVAWSVADALDLDADRLYERLASSPDRHFLWAKRRITDDEAERIRRLNLADRTWGFREEYLRRYPQGRLAAHVLGLRNIDGQGQGGLEQTLDGALRGEDGRRVLVRDARGKVIDVNDEIDQAPRHGCTVVSTLDAVIQLYAERELDQLMAEKKPKGATAIVMDPATCEILALASRPDFDPNDPRDVPDAAWKDLAVTAMFEPGSTFKPFLVAWGLEKGLIRRDEHFDCERGAYKMGRRVLHDHHPYGVLDLTDVLVKSSNIGMAKIGERLTNEQLYRATIHFGFGARTGIELPGELPGLVRPLREWTSYSTGSVPMGQEIAVTPIQLITAHAALANGGTLKSPRIVRDVEGLAVGPGNEERRTNNEERRTRREEGGTGREGPGTRLSVPGLSALDPRPSVISQVCSAETAAWVVRKPLTEVVSRGTGKKARLAEYTVFGKTGTAQKLDPATGTYSHSRYVASFVCGAPADAPRVLVLIVVDEPAEGNSLFGGDVAAPAAARLLQKVLVHLRVPSHAMRTLPAM